MRHTTRFGLLATLFWLASPASAQICNVTIDVDVVTVSPLTDHDGDPTNDVFTRNNFGGTIDSIKVGPVVPGPIVQTKLLPNGQIQVILTNLQIDCVNAFNTTAELIIKADWKTPPLAAAQVSIRAAGSTVSGTPATPDDSGFSVDFSAEIDGQNLGASASSGGFTGNDSFDLDNDGNSAPLGAGPHKLIAIFGFAWTQAGDKFILPDSYVITLGPCTADVNGDGIIDNGDIQEFVSRFLSGNLSVDLNGDGILDNADIQEFVAAFLAGC